MKIKKITLLFLGVFIFLTITQLFAQKILPGITITATNYKYLNSVDPEEVAKAVRMLEYYVAAYDIKATDYYEEEYDSYFISFIIPEGKILAAYDKDGILLHTAEKFKDVAVPTSVSQAIVKKFPNWTISKDVYLVQYYNKLKPTKKLYKLLLENGDKRMRVKIDDQGEFL